MKRKYGYADYQRTADREAIAVSVRPWIPEFEDVLVTIRRRANDDPHAWCDCIPVDACPSCAGAKGPGGWEPRHASCWTIKKPPMAGHVTIHQHAIGHVRGLALLPRLQVYEVGYNHRWLCACHLERHHQPPADHDDMADADTWGTPTLFAMEEN